MLPYRIETLYQHEPWANWTLFGLTIATSLAIQCGLIPEELAAHHFVLGGGSPWGLVGYQFAHAGIVHLLGNMVFLWVFGNAVCATVGNLAYTVLYLSLGAFAGLIHLLVAGTPVIGASGAIAGIVGLAVAFYPINRVEALLSLGFFTRTIRVRLWGLALYWTAWDILGAWLNLDNVAYWAHLGGTAAGLGLGLALLAGDRVQLTEFDNGSLLDLLLRRRPPHQVRPDVDAAFAQRQAAVRAFRASLAAEAEVAPELPQPAKARLRLKLGTRAATVPTDTPQLRPFSTTPLPARPDPLPNLRLRGGQPLAQLPPSPELRAPAGLHQPASAWPASLPDGRYFIFDGSSRHGPVTRAEFLERLAGAPDTSRWLFWVAGMENWRSVSELGGPNDSAAPTTPADTATTAT